MITTSRLGFLRNGCTTAFLRQDGTVLEANKIFIIERTLGPRESKTSLRRRVGTISRGQEADFILKTVS